MIELDGLLPPNGPPGWTFALESFGGFYRPTFRWSSVIDNDGHEHLTVLTSAIVSDLLSHYGSLSRFHLTWRQVDMPGPSYACSFSCSLLVPASIPTAAKLDEAAEFVAVVTNVLTGGSSASTSKPTASAALTLPEILSLLRPSSTPDDPWEPTESPSDP